jgi:hypothetical protein
VTRGERAIQVFERLMLAREEVTQTQASYQQKAMARKYYEQCKADLKKFFDEEKPTCDKSVEVSYDAE